MRHASWTPWLAAGLLAALLAPRDADAVVYGTDDRTEALAHPSPAWQERAQLSIMAMSRTGYAVCDGGATVALPTDVMGVVRELCEDQPFYEQPMLAGCSSTLIDHDLVVTAAHCMFDDDTGESLCPERAFLAGLHLEADGSLPVLTADDVYPCRELLVHVPGVDIAIVQLERPVSAELEPAPISPMPAAEGDAIGAIGFPDGIPMKVADECNVRGLTPSLLNHDCDVFRGNSGSGLFRTDTQELVGVVASAPSDYRKDGDCRVVNVLTQDGQIPGIPSAPQLAGAYPVELALTGLCDLGWPSPLCGTEPACGDGTCTGQETATSCAADCPAPRCGDGVCAILEELECEPDCGYLTELCEEPGETGTTGDTGDTGLDGTGEDTNGTSSGGVASTSGGGVVEESSGSTVGDGSTGDAPPAEGDAGGCGCRAGTTAGTTAGTMAKTTGGWGGPAVLLGAIVLGARRRRDRPSARPR